MGLGTKVKRDNFQAVVKQFAKRVEDVAKDIDNTIKSCQQQAVENLKAARLENFLVFQVDDEPILGIDTQVADSSSRLS